MLKYLTDIEKQIEIKKRKISIFTGKKVSLLSNKGVLSLRRREIQVNSRGVPGWGGGRTFHLFLAPLWGDIISISLGVGAKKRRFGKQARPGIVLGSEIVGLMSGVYSVYYDMSPFSEIQDSRAEASLKLTFLFIKTSKGETVDYLVIKKGAVFVQIGEEIALWANHNRERSSSFHSGC